MANVRSGNTHYVDTTGVLETGACIIVGVILTATSANAVVELADQSGTIPKFNLEVATSGHSEFFDFSRTPISFPKGLKVTTLTSAIVTIVYK